MHQSPQKQLPRRRDKYEAEFDDAEADRRLYRGTHPKARKFPLRDDATRGLRWERPQGGR